jgi:hypothetical protein
MNDYVSQPDKEYFRNSSTTASQIPLSAGYKVFEHLGVFGGVSYDYFHRLSDNSPDPANFGGSLPGINRGRHHHKIGFFGGIQF